MRTLKQGLTKGSVLTDLIHRYSYARDAGFYRLLPRIVVKAKTTADVSTLFQTATARKRKIVFRAGGTSLSGQSISDDILVEVKQGWRELEVLNGGKQIKLQPGVIAAKANQHLERLGYRIGPDPGSINSALMGGIIANNASGIGSGIEFNSYQTLAAMEMILPNGLILNTSIPGDDAKLHAKAPHIYEGLLKLRDQIGSNQALKTRIQNKYKLKNTVGYSLNSFLDYSEPLSILAHLMVGSEGTLGFISSVTLNTVPLQKHKSTALLLLPSLAAAAKLVPKLKRLKSYALEIMDDAAINAIKHIPGLPGEIEYGVEKGRAALLVEYQSNDPIALEQTIEKAVEVIKVLQPEIRVNFFDDPAKREKIWKVRRELGPLHASTRPDGTTVLSEDVCFKIKDLARAIKDLKVLFEKYKYFDAVIFGHAGEGNLHFKLSLDLSQPHVMKDYTNFMTELADLVIEKYDGSLKAEHGTGRNVAPFVEKEWGSEIYGIMQEIKNLLDPAGILNPDVLLSADEFIHVKNIKALPRVDPGIDKCIECGLCEPWCPSADLTFTPRQRISVLREIKTLEDDEPETATLIKLHKAYKYNGVETCATDGLCGISCPADIDTGLFMKQLRTDQHGAVSQAWQNTKQRHFSWFVSVTRMGLYLITPLRLLLVNEAVSRVFRFLARITGGVVPALNSYLLAAKPHLPTHAHDEQVDVVYFPSCLSRTLGDPTQSDLSLPDAFAEVLTAAGLKFKYPDMLSDLCCGLRFNSKGYQNAALQAAIRTTEMLWLSSQSGTLPIVVDTSPCSHHLQHFDQLLSGIHLARWRALRIVDMVEYLHDDVLEKLSLWQVKERIVLHPTCSTRQMGIEAKMEAIAQRCSRDVIIPHDVGCCGFSGDRGLMVPDLTAKATQAEASEVMELEADAHYSSSRTCEIGMSLATNQSYQSLIYLVHEAIIQPESPPGKSL